MEQQKHVFQLPLNRPSPQFAQRWYNAALALFVFTATFFSSNIQLTFPEFSKWFRLGACAVVAGMMLVKIYLFHPMTAAEFARVTALLAAALVLSLVSGDFWMAASALLVAGARDAGLKQALKVYVLTHAVSLALVMLAHAAGILPFIEINRGVQYFDWGHDVYPDWGFGYYNGFAGRLLGLYSGLLVLCRDKLRPWGWALAACAPAGVLILVTSRSGSAAIALALVLMLALRYLPDLTRSRPARWMLQAVLPLCCGFSLYGMAAFDPDSRFWRLIDKLDSLRFSQGHAKWAQYGFRLLGGVPVDTGANDCVDNFYMAVLLNKGVLGLLFALAVFAALMWALPRRGHWAAAYMIAVMLIYGMAENRLFSLIYDPLLIWGSLLLYPAGRAEDGAHPPDKGETDLKNKDREE